MKNSFNVISAQDSQGVKAWRMPEVSGKVINPRGEGASLEAYVQDVPQEAVLALPTAEEIEAIQQAAREEAYAAGFEEGRKNGLQAARQEIDKELARLSRIARDLSEPLHSLDEEVSQVLADLALRMAKAVIASELETRPELVVQVARQALEVLSTQMRQVFVQVNPQDADIVREGLAGQQRVTIQEDAAIRAGGCVVSTSRSRIDATLDARINQIARKVLGSTDTLQSEAEDESES